MKTHTIFEFPLNERVRVFMRLEQLFQQLTHFMKGDTVFDKRAAISVLLDILMIFSRNDLKSELIKELDRQAKFLNQIANSQGVDVNKLTEILDELSVISKKLYKTSGKIGVSVMESDLFQSISQRNAIPGGTCSFDLPAYHFWLEQEHVIQQADLDQWTKPLADIQLAINLVLNFIRQSSTPTSETAEAGFFQLALEQSQPFQLIRIAIDKSDSCFAEVSGGKHRFTIRFLSPSSNNNRPRQLKETINFQLTRCAF